MGSASKTGLRKSSRGAAAKAHTEIEVKLHIPDKRRLLGQLTRLKAKVIGPRVHEMNTLYETPDGSLSRRGQMLRLRVERPGSRAKRVDRERKTEPGKSGGSALLTFKGPAKVRKARRPGRYKIREESEVNLSDPGEAHTILKALGVRPWFRYEKFRTLFELHRMPGLTLALDETPIGVFLELEGPREEINRAAAMLGFDHSAYINKSYGALFMEERGIAGRASHNEPVPFSGVPDMVFGRSNAPRKP